MKIEYDVIAEHSLTSVRDKVRQRIAQGWLPQGGIAVNAENHWERYCQAIIRETFEDE